VGMVAAETRVYIIIHHQSSTHRLHVLISIPFFTSDLQCRSLAVWVQNHLLSPHTNDPPGLDSQKSRFLIDGGDDWLINDWSDEDGLRI
jgi:hypothetical protein